MSKAQTAARYLRAAAASVDTYGEADTIGVLLGEIVGAACYGEGDVMEIAQCLVAARTTAIEEGA
jgi:ADP-ribosylglycohydrolase